MSIKTVTQYFVMAAVIIILGWDGYRMMSGGYEATISYFFIEGSKSHPIIAFLFGVVCGHLFWGDSQYTGKEKLEVPFVKSKK